MRTAVAIARMLSSLFRPAYYPTVGMAALLATTYLSLLPWGFKLWVTGGVYLFTVALPSLGVRAWRGARGLSRRDLRERRHRSVPYLIHLCCYLCLMWLMQRAMMPRLMTSVVAVSLLIQCVCILVNTRWKISVHSAGSGGVTGALLAYAGIFGFNPLWWLCGALLVSGLVMTSRMVLRQHTLGQVLGGTAVGAACGYFGIIIM